MSSDSGSSASLTARNASPNCQPATRLGPAGSDGPRTNTEPAAPQQHPSSQPVSPLVGQGSVGTSSQSSTSPASLSAESAIEAIDALSTAQRAVVGATAQHAGPSTAKSSTQLVPNPPSAGPGPSGSPSSPVNISVALPDTAASGANGQLETDRPHQEAAVDVSSLDIPPTFDGRVRNPVPAKFQDTANGFGGAFGVQHLDVKKQLQDARSEAAKRNSEATQAAAMEATRNGYKPPKRVKTVWLPPKTVPPDAHHQNPSPQQPQQPQHSQHPPNANYSQQHQHPQNPQSGYVTPSHSPHHYAQPQHPFYFHAPGPTPEYAKAEQARLLTFLRSLHPMIVVDQLCKALAYFGGIPGAPVSGFASFPLSDKMNGPGSMLIGWLSEIFPPADFSKPPFSNWAQSPINIPPTGAPVTSSSTPVAPSVPSAPSLSAPEAPSRSKAPEVPGSTNDATQSGPVSQESLKRPRGRPKGSKSKAFRKDKGVKKGSFSDRTRPSYTDKDSGVTSGPENVNEGDLSASNAQEADPDSSIVSAPEGVRRRGRPKGSKNRPKPQSDVAPNFAPPSMDRMVAVGWVPEGTDAHKTSSSAHENTDQNTSATSQGASLRHPKRGRDALADASSPSLSRKRRSVGSQSQKDSLAAVAIDQSQQPTSQDALSSNIKFPSSSSATQPITSSTSTSTDATQVAQSSDTHQNFSTLSPHERQAFIRDVGVSGISTLMQQQQRHPQQQSHTQIQQHQSFDQTVSPIIDPVQQHMQSRPRKVASDPKYAHPGYLNAQYSLSATRAAEHTDNYTTSQQHQQGQGHVPEGQIYQNFSRR